MNRGLKKAVMVGLSASLALTSLAGCSKKEKFDSEAAAVTVNGDIASAGLAKFYVHYQQVGLEELYQMFGMTNALNQDLSGSGTTTGDSLKEGTAAALVDMLLAEQKMDEYEVSLTEEEKADITAAATEFMSANSEETLEKMGATQETVARFLELAAIQYKMETAMTADVDTEVSDEEAAQRKIQYVMFTPSTEEETEAVTDTAETETEAVTDAAETETVTEAVADAAETEAQTALLEENDGAATKSADETEAVTEAVTQEEQTEAVTQEAASEEAETETETEDPAMAAAREEAYAKASEMIEKVKGGMDFDEAAGEVQTDLTSSTMTFGADTTTVSQELITATEGLEDGTLVETPVETTNGYYVVKVLSQLDREATDAQKETIVNQRKQDRKTELYTEWEEASEIKTDTDVFAAIVFDFSLVRETETELETEAVTEAQTEAGTEAEAVTEAQTETETETETEAVTEAQTETETEAVTEA